MKLNDRQIRVYVLGGIHEPVIKRIYELVPISLTRGNETTNQVFEEILSEQHAAAITGVLIVQKESVVHLVETSMDTSTAFLRQIQSMEAELDPSARVMENVGCSLPFGARKIVY